MADDLKRVGLVFKADGTVDFKKSLSEINSSIQENRSAFKLAQSQWDENTKSADKLRDKQKYLSKQTEDYTDKVKLLERELKELEDSENKNAEKLKKKREQFEATKNTAESYRKKCNEIRTELEVLEKNENANEDAIKKKREELEKAEKGFSDYSSRLEKIEKDIDKLNSSESNNATAIQKKQSQLNQAKTSLNNYKKGLKDVEKQLKDGTDKIKQYTKNLEDFSDKAEKVGDKMKGVSKAAAGVLTGAAALVPATAEYRKIMGSLEVSSEMAGYTAEQTEEIYKSLFGVLGDDQSAATTTANLQALGLAQEQLNQFVNGTVGAWAKYGDSIPIDGLSEAINETTKVGKVTGVFADVLNWAGTSEDEFNEKLEACATESERVNLIMQELANQGLMQAGEQWKENNKNLVEGNEATADLQEATAELADTIAPLITDLTELVAGLLGKFNDLPDSAQAVIGIALALIAVSSTVFNTIGKVSMGISSLLKVVEMAKAGTLAFNAAWLASPITWVIAGIVALIAIIATLYDKCEWFRNGVNAIFEKIKNGISGIKSTITGVIEAIKYMFEQFKNIKIPMPHLKITGAFSLTPPSVPKFSVSWYAKGGILTRPTVFDVNGSDVKVGGEKEPEAVLPISLLKRYIREENSLNNSIIAQMIKEAITELNIVAENNIYLGDKKLVAVLTNMVLKRLTQQAHDNEMVKGMA